MVVPVVDLLHLSARTMRSQSSESMHGGISQIPPAAAAIVPDRFHPSVRRIAVPSDLAVRRFELLPSSTPGKGSTMAASAGNLSPLFVDRGLSVVAF